MKAFAILLLLLPLAGCFAPYKVTVYGGSGAPYIAPDICGALVACQNAKEGECYVPSSTTTTASGAAVESYGCKAIPAPAK